MPPRVFRSSLTLPFLPSAETRTASSAASSEDAATASRIWRSRLARSVMEIPSERLNGSDRMPSPRSLRWDLRLRLGRADLVHQSLEGLRLMHREIGEDLAVQLDPGAEEAVHKSAVGE